MLILSNRAKIKEYKLRRFRTMILLKIKNDRCLVSDLQSAWSWNSDGNSKGQLWSMNHVYFELMKLTEFR